MPVRPAPLLFDRFLRAERQPDISRRTVGHIQRIAREARVFVLDDVAAAKVNETAFALPDLVAEHQRFARPPFEVSWFEMTLSSPSPRHGRLLPRHGFLLDHGTLYVVAGTALDAPGGRALLLPYAVEMGAAPSPGASAAFLAATGLSAEEAGNLLVGDELAAAAPGLRAALMDMNGIRCLDDGRRREALFRHHATGGGGLAAIVTTLLLVNRPSLVRAVREVPARRGFSAGHFLPFVGHSVISLDLDPVAALRRMDGPGRDPAAPRRSHEVRGHYCRDRAYRRGTDAGCIHVLARDEAAAHPADSWRCTTCGGRRWWRREHVRGDAGTGVLRQTWTVTAGPSPARRPEVVSRGEGGVGMPPVS